ncbi:MAG TPA: heterodisulfide reductase subunit B [Aquificae bacterium]|nr:heterodisulfide reductase subunit B [Aquificota bacterium]
MSSYAYYPGCVLKGAAKELAEATESVCNTLNIDLKELRTFSCCGAGALEELNEEWEILVNARNLAYAEKEDLDIVTPCSTCLLVLRNTYNKLLSDDKLLEKVNNKLKNFGLKFTGKKNIYHILWVLHDNLEKIKSLVKRPLKNVKVYPFYGCHTIRPYRILGYEPSENPKSIDNLVKACGGEPVRGLKNIVCCGFHAQFTFPQGYKKLLDMVYKEAQELKADCIVTPCPLCHMQMEMYNPLNFPILHVPQLIGLALGISSKALGLHRNLSPVKKLFEKLFRGN